MKLNSTPNTNNLAFIQTFFITLWSSGFIAILWGLRYTNPFTFLLYRMVFAAVFMLIIAIFTKAPWPKDWDTLKKTLLAGLFMQFLYLTSYFYALDEGTSPTIMAIILALQPLLTAIIYSLILKHKVTHAQYLGLLIGFIGVIITIAHDLSTNAISVFGIFLSIISLSSLTIGSIIQKNNPKMDLRSGSTLQFAISIIPLFIISSFFSTLKLPFQINFLLALGWLVLGISVTGNYLYYKLLKAGCAVKINSMFYLVPAVVALLSYIVFGQAINIYITIGIAFIVIGVLITQKSQPQKKQ